MARESLVERRGGIGECPLLIKSPITGGEREAILLLKSREREARPAQHVQNGR